MALRPKREIHIIVARIFFALALITACFAFPLPVKASNTYQHDTEKSPNNATNLFIIFVLLGFLSMNANTPRS